MDCSKNSASGEAAANTGARFLITAEQKTRGRFWNSVEQQIICIWRFWTGGELAKSKWHVFNNTDRVGHQSLFLIEITPQNHSLKYDWNKNFPINYTGLGKKAPAKFGEYEEEKLHSSACCRKENAIFPPHIHQTWPEPFSRALYSLPHLQWHPPEKKKVSL